MQQSHQLFLRNMVSFYFNGQVCSIAGTGNGDEDMTNYLVCMLGVEIFSYLGNTKVRL